MITTPYRYSSAANWYGRHRRQNAGAAQQPFADRNSTIRKIRALLVETLNSNLMTLTSPNKIDNSGTSALARTTLPLSHDFYLAITIFCVIALLSVGCGTTTQRTATEQMLMSDAVDMAIARIDFRPLSDRKAFLDTTFIRPNPAFPGQVPSQLQGLVNADYVVSSLRQHLFASRCELVDDRTLAEVIIEPRIGTLATNGHDIVYGLPQTNALSQVAASLAGGPILPAIPELSVGRSNSQYGLAKIMVFAYEKETKQPVWQSGVAKSESSARSTWFLGAGPFQRGTIYNGYRFAGRDLKRDHNLPSDSEQSIPYGSEHVFVPHPKPILTAEQQTDPVATGESNPAIKR